MSTTLTDVPQAVWAADLQEPGFPHVVQVPGGFVICRKHIVPTCHCTFYWHEFAQLPQDSKAGVGGDFQTCIFKHPAECKYFSRILSAEGSLSYTCIALTKPH